MTDLDANLMNVEGSPVLDKKSGEILGIRLPNVHNATNSLNFATFSPIVDLLELLVNRFFNVLDI